MNEDIKTLQRNYDNAVRTFNNAPSHDFKVIDTAIYMMKAYEQQLEMAKHFPKINEGVAKNG